MTASGPPSTPTGRSGGSLAGTRYGGLELYERLPGALELEVPLYRARAEGEEMNRVEQ